MSLGYIRLTGYKISDDKKDYTRYEILDLEVFQFGFTVPSPCTKITSPLDTVNNPHEWLHEYVSESMADCSYLDDLTFDKDIKKGDFFQIIGMISVIDTGGMTSYGYEYDSELIFDDYEVQKFTLENLKYSYYFDKKDISEWKKIIGLTE